MANDYVNVPVLSQVEVSGTKYYLKDAEARGFLNAVEGRVKAIEEAPYASEGYVQEEIAKIPSITYEIVAELPTADAEHEFKNSKKVYLISEGAGKEKDYFGEYICIDKGESANPRYAWEKIGDTRIDFSAYRTAEDQDLIDNAIIARIVAIENQESKWNNKLDTVKINGTWKTLQSDTEHGEFVDLGNIATAEASITDVEYIANTHTLNKSHPDPEDPEQIVTKVVHAFGDLAEENLANLEVIGETVSGLKAKGNSAGSLSGNLGYVSTEIELSGNASGISGDVDIEKSNVTASHVTNGGSVATFTEGAFTPNVPTAIDVSKFNGGSVATFTEGAFTPASLTYAASDEFVKEGIKAEVGTGSDSECLILSAVTNKGTASVISAFSGGSKDADTFNGGSVASLEAGFYTAGTAANKVADTFNGGAMPTFEDVTSTNVTGGSFSGASGTVSVSGNYDKANLGTLAFAADSIELNVDNVVIATKNVSKKA